jgi:CRP/FNR family transcriptional regulator, cyclic AMP receptor protein
MSERVELDKRDAGSRRPFDGNTAPKSSPSISPPLTDPHKFLAQIAERSTSSYVKDAIVFVQGADADSVFYLQDGRVKVSVTSDQGEETNIAILETGRFFGEGCLGGQNHRVVTARALTDCRITIIGKTAMIEALEKQPWFCKVFMDHLIARDRQVESEAMDQLAASNEQRLVRLLLEKLDDQRTQIESVLHDRLTMNDGAPGDQ